MLGELEEVRFRALELGEERPFHLLLLMEIQEAAGRSATDGVGEFFLAGKYLFPEDVHVFGVVSAAVEELHIVESVAFAMSGYGLEQVLADESVAVCAVCCHKCRDPDASGINLRPEGLAAL